MKLAIARPAADVGDVNRVAVDGSLSACTTSRTRLEQYLPDPEHYDPRPLDAAAVRQLVLAYEAKAASLELRAEYEQSGPRRTRAA